MNNTPKATVFTTLEAAIKVHNFERAYRYMNPDTQNIELVVVRYRDDDNKKKFMQVSSVTNGWIRRGPSGKLPLYNRGRVGSAENVIVVEGEKAVDELAEIDIVATTSPGGAGKAHKADWSPLEGKTVYLWSDNDPEDPKTKKRTGEEHMRDIANILEPIASRVFWVDERRLGLPEKGDAVEFLKNNQGSKEAKRIAVQLVLDEADAIDGVSGLRARLKDIISGEWTNIEFPWYETSAQTQSLLPGTVTALCGDPGAAKSLWMLQAFWHWHLAGERTALFMLEDDKTYHMQRVLAQLEQNAELTNADWVRTHGEEAIRALENQQDVLERFQRTLHDAPNTNLTLDELADWFEQRCSEGAMICGIDPVTAAQVSDKPWIDDQRFIFRVKEIAKRYHSRLIYVIHPRVSQGKLGPSLSRLAGGAAYPRFSHTVFWLMRHDRPQIAKVYSSDFGKRPITYERTLRITKARNGKGAGLDLAFTLNPKTLCFEEHGIMVEEMQGEDVATLTTSRELK
jgi:hypothetical protein